MRSFTAYDSYNIQYGVITYVTVNSRNRRTENTGILYR